MDRFSFLHEMRLEMAFAPHWIIVSKADWHRRMQAHYEERVQALSRPWYHEAPGFAGGGIAGREKPYLWSRPYWQAFGRMLKHCWLAGYYGAMDNDGGEHHRYDGNRNRHAIITGLTS